MSVTVSQLSALADDGLLGGQPVESDAELLKLPGLSRRDRVQFGSVEDMTALELGDRTGRIGRNYIAPDIPADRLLSPEEYDALQERIALGLPDVESTVGVRTPEISPYRQLDIAADGDTFNTIPHRGLYACPNVGRDKVRVVKSVRGGSYRVPLVCEDAEGDCPECRQHWVDSAALRLRHGLIGDTQLVITSEGHQTPADAQKVVTAIGRQLGAVRRAQVLSRTLAYTHAAHIIVTGAMPLPAVLEQIKDRLGVSAEYRPVSDDDLKALLHSRSKVDGKRCPIRFLHWPKGTPADAATTTYAHNDGYVADAMDAKTIPEIVHTRRRSLKIPESMRVRLREFEAAANADTWLTGMALDLVELLKLRNARRAGVRSKNDWQDSIAAGTYDGPKALIRDLAAALDDDGMVAYTSRRCMMVAASYIGGE